MKTIYKGMVCLLLALPVILNSQRIAFVGISNDNPDEMAFVAVDDLPASTVIYFTDEEYWDNCDGFYFNNTCSGQAEDYWFYTAPASVVASGTVVVIRESATNVLSIISGPGTVTRGGLASYNQTQQDVLHAFLASNPADPFGSLTEVLASINVNTFDGSDNHGENPISNHPNAIVFEDTGAAVFENADYTAMLREEETSVQDLLNPSNFTTDENNFSLSTINFTSAILPVELVSFTAQAQEKYVLLKWETSSEENNDYFEIERSIDGLTFESIGKVTGNGTTAITNNYAFLDQFPSRGTNYYRLRQVDFDGRYEYSDIRLVNFSGKTEQFSLAPNPTQDEVHLYWQWASNSEEELWAEVYDLYGNRIRRYQLQAKSKEKMISLSDLPAGTYLVQLQSDANRLGAPVRLVKL